MTQLFRPILGADFIVGAVGQLQFEVMADRLANEYQLEVIFEASPYAEARWLAGEKTDIEDFQNKHRSAMGVDLDEQRERHVVTHELEPGIRVQVIDVLLGPGKEIIDAQHVVAPREEHFWTKLRGALGDPEELARPEFDDARSRQIHREELLPLLEDIFVRRDSREWLETLQAAGVPAAPVNRMPEVFDDPHVAARRMIRSFSLDDTTVKAVGNAIKVLGAEEPPASAPPALGGDAEDVLRTVLGYDDARIARLREAGVFGEAVSA